LPRVILKGPYALSWAQKHRYLQLTIMRTNRQLLADFASWNERPLHDLDRSLRRGFITDAAKKKVPIENIKRVTGQRSSNVVLNYIAAATIDEQPPLLEIVNGTECD